MGREFVYISGDRLDPWSDRERFMFVKAARDCGVQGVYVNTMALDDYNNDDATGITIAARTQRHRSFVSLCQSAGLYVIWSSYLRPRDTFGFDPVQDFYSLGDIERTLAAQRDYAAVIGADEWGTDTEIYGRNPMKAMKQYDLPQPTFGILADIYATVAKTIQADIVMPVGSQQAARHNWVASQLGKRHVRWYNERIEAGRYRQLVNGGPMNPDKLPTDAANGFEFVEQPNPMYGYFVTLTGTPIGNSVPWLPEQYRSEAMLDHPEDSFFYTDNSEDIIVLMHRAQA